MPRMARRTEEVEFLTQRHRRSRSTTSCTVREESFVEESSEVIDLTIDDSELSYRILRPDELSLVSFQVAGGTVQRGSCVEVVDTTLGPYKISFVLIKAIVRHAQQRSAKVRGIPFARTRDLEGMLPKKKDEVCRVLLTKGNGSTAPDASQNAAALVDIDIAQIVCKRRLIFTNALWPKHSCHSPNPRERHRTQGSLICRWTFSIVSEEAGQRMSRPVEESLERIRPDEVTERRYRESPDEQSRGWLSSEDHRQPGHNPRVRRPGQKYTVFDSFCGAGGVSRGAQIAGLSVTHAIDKSDEVWATYRANFRGTNLFTGSVDEYIHCGRSMSSAHADFLHLSPPCQFFSPAHTHNGPNDEANSAALFSCGSLIEKVRPRIITVEQTFGLASAERHRGYFHTHLNDFTQLGYSVRWRVVKLCTWGSAQSRKRLIIIAAGPGEKLPPFPPPTHSDNPREGLEPFMTMRRAIRGARARDELHDLRCVKWHSPPRPAIHDNSLAGTLLTGGSVTHPDGQRDLTLRELASLQGFPIYHTFKGNRTSIKRQIGNAFPPNTVKVLYSHLRRWLEQQDGIQTAHQTTVVIDGDDTDVVIIDDEEPIVIEDEDVIMIDYRDAMIVDDDWPRTSGRLMDTMMHGVRAMIDLT